MPTFRPLLAATAAMLLAVPHARAQQYAKDSTKADTAATKPKTPALDFSGWLFGNYQVETDDASQKANGGSHANKFDIERAYLTFKMPAGKRMSVRITTDIQQGQGDPNEYQGWFVGSSTAICSGTTRCP